MNEGSVSTNLQTASRKAQIHPAIVPLHRENPDRRKTSDQRSRIERQTRHAQRLFVAGELAKQSVTLFGRHAGRVTEEVEQLLALTRVLKLPLDQQSQEIGDRNSALGRLAFEGNALCFGQMDHNLVGHGQQGSDPRRLKHLTIRVQLMGTVRDALDFQEAGERE